MEEKLRNTIYRLLKGLKPSINSKVYAAIQTKEGYTRIETEIINRVLRDRMLPDEIIPQLESEANEQ